MKYSKVPESQKIYQYRLKLDQQGHIGQGRITSPALALERLERSCAVDKLMDSGQHGRQGLGFKSKFRKVDPRRELIERFRKEAEEKRLIILHKYEMQSSWLFWGLNQMMASDNSWSTLLFQYSQRLLKFMVNAQLNTLPTPDNLRRWNLSKDSVCGLCAEKLVALSHVLAGCPWVRTVENKLQREDRFTWRHNNVLYLLASVIQGHLDYANKRKVVAPKNQLIRFIKAGQTHRPQLRRTTCSVIEEASDWVLDFDLPEWRLAGSAYVFPHEICATPLKIDGHIISRAARVCFGLELTCQMEENIEKWHQSKLRKYDTEISFEVRKMAGGSIVSSLRVGTEFCRPSSSTTWSHGCELDM